MKLSVVTSVHGLQNLDTLKIFYEKIDKEITKNIKSTFEVIFVIDEDSDSAFNYLINLKNTYENIKIINLTRNFGHHEALLTGIENSTGDLIFVIDCDLEENPELISEFYKNLIKEDTDLVLGFQNNRKGKIFERLSGNLAYFYINKILKINYPKNPTTASMMTSRFKDALLLHKEKNINYVGLLKITGFKNILIPIEKTSVSLSTYSFRKKFNHLVNISFLFPDTNYSLVFYISLINFIFSLTYVIYLIINYFNNNIVGGYTSVIVSIWFFSSIIILLLGIISFYLKLILKESIARPKTIIKDIV